MKPVPVILAWPDRSLTWEAALWLARHGLLADAAVVCRKGPVDVVRNRVVQEALAGSKADAFLFMDRDMRPRAAADPVLVTPGDVVACLYPTGNMETWSEPGAIHLGLVRVARKVLETLLAERDAEGRPVPLFAFARSADGTRVEACECRWFAERVRKAGFEIVRAGWCDHAPLKG